MVKNYIDLCTMFALHDVLTSLFFPPLTEETSEVVDPSMDNSTENKENMPECSDNISTENSPESTTFPESEGGGEEIQSTQTVRKGGLWFLL